MELSSLIGKRILSPAGEDLGYVVRAYLARDLRKLSSLVCADGEEEEFYLPVRALLSVSDIAVAGKARLKAPTGVLFPAGYPVYSEKGERLGFVSDYIFGEAESAFVALDGAARKTFPAAEVRVRGSVVLRVPDGARRAAAPKAQTSEREAQAPPPKPADPAPAGGSPVCNRLDLLGKKVKKSVLDGFGAPIVRAGERITPAVIAAARRQNRLLQLAVNTYTNLI